VSDSERHPDPQCRGEESADSGRTRDVITKPGTEARQPRRTMALRRAISARQLLRLRSLNQSDLVQEGNVA